MGKTNEWFDDMLEEGFVSTSSTWLERAVEQTHPKLSLALLSAGDAGNTHRRFSLLYNLAVR